MAVADGRGALARAMKELLGRWGELQAVWSDAQSQEFEKTYLQAIEQDVRSALGSLDHINQVLMALENDCE
jgi:hypothetical protein